MNFADQSHIITSDADLPNTQQISTPTSVPSALPTPNSAAMDDVQIQSQLSPSMAKKPLSFKKAKGQDLNKYDFFILYLMNKILNRI